MARKLKTYQTSLGFYDLAIAAPSMKAALDAWGADSNLFHQKAARESDDPDIVAAAMAKPGVVLKRPVGSDGAFREHAELPKHLGDHGRGSKSKKTAAKPSKPSPNAGSARDDRQAAVGFEKEQVRRARERKKDEAAKEQERNRRQRDVRKAEEALNRAKISHEKKALAIDAERAALETRAQAEAARWAKDKQKLEAALRRARD